MSTKDKKYKIASVFQTSHADTAGNAVRISILRILAENYELIVLTNQLEFVKTHLNCDVVYVPYVNISLFSNYLFWFRCFLKLLFSEFDLLFCFHDTSPIGFGSFHRPFLCYIHQSHEILGFNSIPEKNDIKTLIKKTTRKIYVNSILKGIRHAAFCFAVSEQLKDFFIEQGVKKEKISYLPHGVDLSLFRNENPDMKKVDIGVTKKRFIIMYAGWVSEKRGLNLLLNGLAAIKEDSDDVHMVIIGCEENYIRKINQIAVNLNVLNNLTMIGRVDYSLIPAYLQKADVCLSFLEVNKTYSLSPPQKIFEYLAMGKPVIANNIPTHTDYIQNGYNGYIIDMDPVQFKQVVMRLYNNRGQYKQISKNCIECSKRYDIRIVENKLMSKINNLIVN